MATKKAAASPAVKVPKILARSIKQMQDDGRTVQVLGRVQGGKLEIDQNSLADLLKKFPNAKMSFVAVNAPFDPKRCTV
jgi:hypothetical protein